jgi:hypothetical protein
MNAVVEVLPANRTYRPVVVGCAISASAPTNVFLLRGLSDFDSAIPQTKTPGRSGRTFMRGLQDQREPK